MYAIVETGGKQYRVEEGSKVVVEKLAVQSGSEISLDKVLMVPKEGFGFSRDAPVRFGPPRFAAAALTLGEGEVRAEIRMRYLL